MLRTVGKGNARRVVSYKQLQAIGVDPAKPIDNPDAVLSQLAGGAAKPPLDLDNLSESSLEGKTFEDFRVAFLTQTLKREQRNAQDTDPRFAERAAQRIPELEAALKTRGKVPDYLNKGLTDASVSVNNQLLARHTDPQHKGFNSYSITPEGFRALRRDLRNTRRINALKEANKRDSTARTGEARPYVGKRWRPDIPVAQYTPKAGDRIHTRIKDDRYGGGGYTINQTIKSVSPKLIKFANTEQAGSQMRLDKFQAQLRNETYLVRGKTVQKLT